MVVGGSDNLHPEAKLAGCMAEMCTITSLDDHFVNLNVDYNRNRPVSTPFPHAPLP